MIKYKDEFWGFIPARSGSKGIKNKNIKIINGKPLIFYSIALALKTRGIAKVIFSSDSNKYIKLAKKYGCKNFHIRSKKLSNDKASEFSVFRDFIRKEIKKKVILPKYFVHLRPTSPIRKTKTVIKAIKTFYSISKKYSSLCSINSESETAFKSTVIINKKLCGAFKKASLDSINLPRQKFPKTYKFNGIVDIFKTENIVQNRLYGKKVYPFDTGKDFHIEIDTRNDLSKVKNYFL